MQVVYEKKTDKSLNEAIDALQANLKKESFGVLWQFNIKDKIQGQGLEFKDDYVILEVCNPKIAKDILEVNIHVGYMLPCKMVVRRENNTTYMGMTRPELLIGLFEDPKTLDIAKKVESILKDAIEASI